MRWLQAVVTALSILATTGCPSEFGKDGRIAKAVHKDSKENLLELTRCSAARIKEVCEGPNRDDGKCRECGGK